MPQPVERQIATAIADNVVWLDQRLVDDHNRESWRAFVHAIVPPVSWDAPAAETSEQRISRAYALWALGNVGDEQVVVGARRVAAQYMKDPGSLDALIADRALRLSAVYGDEAFFNRVVEQLEKAPNPEVANRYRALLPLFRDPKVMARAIDYIYSDRVRTQDLPMVVGTMFGDPATRPAAWAAAKSRWADIEKRSPAPVGRIAASTSAFCDAESRKDVETFFAAHPMRTGQRSLTRALESIDTCIAFRAGQQAAFDKKLN